MTEVVKAFAGAGSGTIVYGASQANELAHEDKKGRYSAFTEALIEAIGQGKGARDGRITTALLQFYISQRVFELTGGAQHPV